MEDRDLTPGTVVLGKYRVDELIGTGGMGRVIRASHLYLQQSVAIKILLPQMTESPSTVARFLREAQAAVRLKSEHTARVIDVGTMPDGAPFMIMEYLEGNDLNQILRHHGPQAPAIVCDLMLQACEGLAEAHAIGIVHRDIKPSNFFVTRRPDGSMLLKILDFGISKTPVNYSDELTGTQTVIGTPSYMAPEQMKSGKQAEARSDIWSMGIVMYQLLQGRPPFSADSYPELVLKVASEPPNPFHVPLPPGLGQVILRCLEKHVTQRQQNVGELARMLAPFASDPVTAAQIANRAARILQQRASHASVDRGALPGQQSLPTSAGGGLATPIPLSPAQLTPRSWPPSTSLSQGRGQITHQVGSSKGWMIAGALSLTILAAAGGYVASSLIKNSGDDEATSSTTAATAPTAATPTATTPAPAATTPAATTPTLTPPTPPPTTPTIAPTIPPTPTIAPTIPTTPTVAPTVPTVPATKTMTVTTTVDPKTGTATTNSSTTTTPTTTTPTKTDAKVAKSTTSKTETKKKSSTKKTSKTTTPKTTTTKTTTPKTTTKSTGSKSDLFNSRH